MTDNLLITGAGVDRTKGIEFPLADTLLPEVTDYLRRDGVKVDAMLRRAIPRLRFTFTGIIQQAIGQITSKDPSDLKTFVAKISHETEKIVDENSIQKKQGLLIVRLFNRLVTIAENNTIDEETEKLLREVFPTDADELIANDSIVDIRHLSLSETFKTVLKRSLQESLSTTANPIAKALGSELLNIERLLIEKFLGFYNRASSDIKNYIYIAWCLWAYLVHKQQQVYARFRESDNMPFYGTIPKGTRAITLNYTSFLEDRLGKGNVIYFHGGLAEYVRMDTRDLNDIENLRRPPEDILERIVTPNLDLGSDNPDDQVHVIPALVPPLRLKPILSRRYIEFWHNADQWVKHAKRVIIIGYSFNTADEHFNDILRTHDSKDYIVVGPDTHTEVFKRNMQRVLGAPLRHFTSCEMQGHPCLKAGHVRLVKCYADQFNIEAAFKADLS